MIELKNVTKTVRSGAEDLTILDDVSMAIPDGQFVAVTGASGSGKTTLLAALPYVAKAWWLQRGHLQRHAAAHWRRALVAGSLVAGVYEKTIDRESAYEKLKARATAAPAASAGTAAGSAGPPDAAGAAASGGGMLDAVKDIMLGSTGPRGGRREGLVEKAASSAVRSIGSSVGRELIRGVLGSLLGSKRR